MSRRSLRSGHPWNSIQRKGAKPQGGVATGEVACPAGRVPFVRDGSGWAMEGEAAPSRIDPCDLATLRSESGVLSGVR